MGILLKYIIVVVIVSSVSFSIENSKKGTAGSNGGSLVSLQELIIGEDDENTIQRKRAHKRKRKVRPRRNGF